MASNTSENDSKASPIKTSSTSPLGIRSPGPAAATISPPGQKKPRQNSASSSGRPSVEASSAQKAAQPFSQTPSTPSRTGRGTMTGASASIHARASGGNNNVASPSTPNRRQSNTSIGKQSNSPPSSNSTLNPNAGGFLPGGLGSLAEVRDEVLITPVAGNFDFDNSRSFASPEMFTGNMFTNSPTGGNAFQNGGNATNSIAQQLASLQQMQLMQQALMMQQSQQPSANLAQTQQMLEMQQQLLAQMSLNPSSLGGMNAGLTANANANNVPPRFAAAQQMQQMLQQSQNMGLGSAFQPTSHNNTNNASGDVSSMMAEQMAIQQQLDSLRAQQDALLNRFAEMQSPADTMSPGSYNNNNTTMSPNAAGGFANAARAGHRRIQSQQAPNVQSTPNTGTFAMGQFGVSPTQPMGAFVQNNSTSKGHGRRHSVNVVPKGQQQAMSPGQMTSPPLNSAASMASMGMGMNEYGGELDFGASPTSNATASGMPFVPGHGRRDSRGSISSLSGWGTNSGHYVQNAIPSATTTDLAQATSQLQQLSAFRASAGHAKVPSFGLSQLQGNFSYGHQHTPSQASNAAAQRKSLFAPYLPAASIPPLVAAGKLVVGALRVNKRNRSDAYVATDLLDSDIYICGSKDRNRALEGDIVAVELLDVDEVWGTKKEKEEKKRKKEENASYDPRASQHVRKQDKKNDDVEVEGQGMTLFEDEEVNDDQRPQFAGHVVGVVHRAPGQLFAGTLGVLRPSSAATKEKQEAERRERDGVDLRGKQDNAPVRIVWLRPVDKRVPLLAIPVNEAPSDFVENPDKYSNRLFCACIKRWPITSLHPFGTLVEELGPIGDIETETSALLKDCGFSTDDFNESVLKCLPPIPYTIPAREYEIRRDLRDLRVFSIDPETAKDLDDALHITKKEDGTYEVGVHIADVSFFVKPNSPLDREARKRATTVYLVQRAYPMLPPALSEQLCSLTPGEDKLCFSVIFTMSAEARVLSTWFGKTIVKSCARLSYKNAQSVIEHNALPEGVKIFGDRDADGIKTDLLDLVALARQLTDRRFSNSALRIENIKLNFTLDAQGVPQDCVLAERRDANSLVEEFMLLTNIAVAQHVAAGLPEQALLRRHEEPIDRRMLSFADRAKRLGLDVDTSTSSGIMKSFQHTEDHNTRMLLQLLATKAMMRAKYFCSGMLDIAKYHHYALNVPLYTHFTSPIRRYADIIVHRQLETILSGTAELKFSLDTEAVSQIAQQCNSKKDAARLAHEQSQHLYLCTMIANLTQQYGPVIRQAQVIGVLDEAFDVLVPDFGIEKRVHIDQMPIENHVWDEHGQTLSIYWKKGINVVKWLAENSGDAHLQMMRQNAERHAQLMETSDAARAQDESALFDDEEDASQTTAAGGDKEKASKVDDVVANSTQHRRSANKSKTPPKFEGVEVTATGHHIQLVKELQSVPVIVTADLTKSPPVIKVISLNPFPN